MEEPQKLLDLAESAQVEIPAELHMAMILASQARKEIVARKAIPISKEKFVFHKLPIPSRSTTFDSLDQLVMIPQLIPAMELERAVDFRPHSPLESTKSLNEP